MTDKNWVGIGINFKPNSIPFNKFVNLNEILVQKYKSKIILDENNNPHVNLYDIDIPSKNTDTIISKLEKFEKIGLVTSIQFVKTIPIVRKFLEQKGKKIFTYKHQQYEGQMLGCRIGAGKMIENKVDCFLCISAGKFYGLGLALETNKPLLNIDLETRKIHDMKEVKKKIQKFFYTGA